MRFTILAKVLANARVTGRRSYKPSLFQFILVNPSSARVVSSQPPCPANRRTRSGAGIRSGGYLLCVALKQHGDALAVAAARVRTAKWGGSLFNATDVGAMLTDAGFSNVRLLPNAPTNVTQLLAARKA
jgi:hypothetical protein